MVSQAEVLKARVSFLINRNSEPSIKLCRELAWTVESNIGWLTKQSLWPQF
jgi:hypothetical protein